MSIITRRVKTMKQLKLLILHEPGNYRPQEAAGILYSIYSSKTRPMNQRMLAMVGREVKLYTEVYKDAVGYCDSGWVWHEWMLQPIARTYTEFSWDK